MELENVPALEDNKLMTSDSPGDDIYYSHHEHYKWSIKMEIIIGIVIITIASIVIKILYIKITIRKTRPISLLDNPMGLEVLRKSQHVVTRINLVEETTMLKPTHPEV